LSWLENQASAGARRKARYGVQAVVADQLPFLQIPAELALLSWGKGNYEARTAPTALTESMQAVVLIKTKGASFGVLHFRALPPAERQFGQQVANRS
jgi:hypothetical protein